jgi:DNA repair exonuclease SbcCD ATPase subunit
MLERIVIENFQVHRRLDVRLDPHVTTFVGESDAGKSAVVRAVWWAAFNDPTGADFVRHGADTATVSLKVDRRWIVRERGPAGNLYQIDNDTPHRAFGTAVPEDVRKILNLSPVNFQEQIDPPFWFTETPGEVARNLNAVVNLGVIDRTVAAAAASHKKARIEVEVCEERVRAAEARRKELSAVPDLGAGLARLGELEARHVDARVRTSTLAFLLGQATELDGRARRLRRVCERGAALVELGTDAAVTAANRFVLAQVLEQIETAEAVLAVPVPDLGDLIAQRARADRTAERRRELEMLLKEIAEHEEALCRLQKRTEEHETTLRNSPAPICPTCGQPVTSSPPSPTSTTATTRPSSGPASRTGTPPRRGRPSGPPRSSTPDGCPF